MHARTQAQAHSDQQSVYIIPRSVVLFVNVYITCISFSNKNLAYKSVNTIVNVYIYLVLMHSVNIYRRTKIKPNSVKVTYKMTFATRPPVRV